VSPIPREARPYQGHPAGVVTRTIAAAIDAGIAFTIAAILYVVVVGFLVLVSPWQFDASSASVLLGLGHVLVVLTAYLAVCWATTGRTIGHLIMGLRVVGWRQRTMRPGVALVRAAFCVVFPVGLFWCAINRNRRSVQDIVLRTAVLYDWAPNAFPDGESPLADEDAEGGSGQNMGSPATASGPRH
jgi:uncharacterized RDD family membrane protein YckC